MEYVSNRRFQPKNYDTVVIFHAGCPDGAASAFAFTCGNFGSVYYHHASERNFQKDKYMPILADRNVYIVDYSYSKDTLEYINSIAKSLHVYDHHKTAFDDLKDLSYCVFDMNRCGAEITWDELYPTVPRPWFIKHISDRDLWLWKHPNSGEFSAVFQEEGLRIDVLERLSKYTPIEIDALYVRGGLLMNFEKKIVKNLCSNAEKITFEKYPVYALNASIYASECGNELTLRDCSFALIYRYIITENRYAISLRGIPNAGIDLGTIAKKYGGGGHPLSSGFTWNGPILDLFALSNV